jgi:hypothetical protein
MRKTGFLVTIAMLALQACGGGGSPSSLATVSGSPTGGGAAANISAVTVSSDLASIPADGSVSANITALVKDANNNAISGVAVTIAASAGSLVISQATTNSSGQAKAALSASGVAPGTAITVTATAGSVSKTVTVNVVNTQRTIAVVTSLPQIPSDASAVATISALVRDASNNVVPGVTVAFQSTSGSLVVTQAVTDATGVAKASLDAGNDPTNRSITVTATAGTATANVAVLVTGTTITITGPNSLILNQSANYTIKLANSGNKGIPAAAVTVTSATGNTLSNPAPTDANGQTTVTITGRTSGSDTITATALGIQAKLPLTVSSDNFAFSAPANNAQVNLGASQTVTVNWLSSNVPKVGQTVTFAATRGTLATSTAVTDANGNASVNISSTSGGPSIITATGTGVSAQLTLNFIAVAPSQIAVQANPATVPAGGQSKSTITATVRDAANNLVQGATVDFLITADPTNGSLLQSTGVTDAQGQATTSYVPGNTSSGANAVHISATVRNTAITATTNLTVGGQTVFLSLGTGNTIDVTVASIYQIVYSVFAVDASGAALANVPITVSVLPVAYGKGWFAGCPGGTNWSPLYSTTTNDPGSYSAMKLCKNEDTDYTGNINSLVGKDYNANGKLDPGNIAVVSPGSGSTDSTGRLAVTVTYPRDHAYWVRVKLVAKTIVNGTESSTSSEWTLQGVNTDYACSVAPPGPLGQDPSGNSVITSPYGVQNTCANPN